MALNYSAAKDWSDEELLKKCLDTGAADSPNYKDASLLLQYRLVQRQLTYSGALNCFTGWLTVAAGLQALAAIALAALAAIQYYSGH